MGKHNYCAYFTLQDLLEPSRIEVVPASVPHRICFSQIPKCRAYNRTHLCLTRSIEDE